MSVLNASEAAPPSAAKPPKLATVKLDAPHARQIAKQLQAAGREADAQSLLDALANRARVTIKMPVDNVLKTAIAMHRNGGDAMKKAESYYKAVLAADPDHARANHFFGVLLHNTHRTRKAAPHLARSMRELANEAWAWNNLGIVHRERGEHDKAEDAYRRALALKDDFAEAHNNYGVMCRWAKRLDEAERRFRRAIELNPNYAEAMVNLGNLVIKQGRTEEGLDLLSRAIILAPKNAQPRVLLAYAHMRFGDPEKAAAVYREWIDEEPDNPTPRHLLAAIVGGAAPERAADDYVAFTFDGFAKTFDAKLAHLGYRAPELVANALAAAHKPGASYGIVCDAGCGTGLCAPLIGGRSRRLVGVDLSSGMLAQAKERGGYHELHEAELTAFLEKKAGAYDVIISADTLCYFGVLDGFARAAHAATKPGGVLVFTVEALPDDAADRYLLQTHGRYAHRRSYVEQALSEAGFAIEALARDALRNEDGKPVRGWIVTARRPA